MVVSSAMRPRGSTDVAFDPSTGQSLLFPVHTPRHILPTNVTADRHPFHRWFGFVPGFSPEYVRECIDQADLAPGDHVLDPFAGCGTTMVEANALGLPSLGFEPHVFLADICRAKVLVDANPDWALQIQRSLESGAASSSKPPALAPAAKAFLEKLLPADSLGTLLHAREAAKEFRGPKELLARLILSRVLDLCSHSKTDGIYKAPTSRKLAASFATSLTTTSSMISKDLGFAREAGLTNQAKVLPRSSEDMSSVAPRSCGVLITSPPYLNNFDFAEMTRMHLYFWEYARDWNEISERVRAKLIVNTTTALNGHRQKMEAYREETPAAVRAVLDSYQEDLADRRRLKAGKKEYDRLVYPYFAQMTRVLKSAATALKPRAPVRIIVSDAALYGVHIRTQEVLATIMDSLCYDQIAIHKLRSRGHRWILDKREGAADGLGEYELIAVAPRRASI